MTRLALALALLLMVPPANAHLWYSDEVNEKGVNCCDGECRALEAGAVIEIKMGYYIVDLDISIPFELAKPSPDGQYHICEVAPCATTPSDPTSPCARGWRCFWAPMPGS